MSNLSELLPAGGGGKNVNFVASGTLGNGVAVGLKADGTVEAITGITTTVGTPSVFKAVSSTGIATTYDSTNNKIVIVYRDGASSYYGTAIIGTVSGSSISFGTATVFESASIDWAAITYDSTNNKIVIAYIDYGNSEYGTSIVGTVSGTSISFGSPSVFNSASTSYIKAAYDSTNNKVVFAYKDSGNGNKCTGIVGTVSGTSISFGTEAVVGNSETSWSSVAYDATNNKIVIAYQNGNNSSYGEAIVGTISGTSISYGTSSVFSASNSQFITPVFDNTNGKMVITYRDNGNSSYGAAVVGTISGTSISFGSSTFFESASTEYLSATYNSVDSSISIGYQDEGNSNYGTAVTGTVSETSISFGTATVFETAKARFVAPVYDTNAGKVVIAYQDEGNSEYGTAVTYRGGLTNNASFLGITDAAIADTETGSVTIKGGLKSGLTGLTPNSIYYTQADGSISTVSTAPAVRIGKSLSSTTLNLEFNS